MAFRSLFEILIREEIRLTLQEMLSVLFLRFINYLENVMKCTITTFRSLFEIPTSPKTTLLCSKSTTFRSLFEIHDLYPWEIECPKYLSVLFLRFSYRLIPNEKIEEIVELSVLFLRFDCSIKHRRIIFMKPFPFSF